jgi:hypothetical protein
MKLPFALFLLIPTLAFGQLFPKVADFKGNLRKVIEKRYGKELSVYKKDSGVFQPKAFSGWEYIYEFDKTGKLTRRTISMDGSEMGAYRYEREEEGNRRVEREIIEDDHKNRKGDYIEYENLLNADGQVEKVNFWSYNAREKLKELFLVEQNAVYENGRLVSYTRHAVMEDDELESGEQCSLFYDEAGKLTRMERQDISSGYKTILYYNYNKRGLVNLFTIDYLVGLRKNQNKTKQDIFYKYDRRGNWKKRYWMADKKRHLEDKRKIKYN